MLLKYAEANAVNTSRAHNVGGLQPSLPKWNSLCAPLVQKHWPQHILKTFDVLPFEVVGHPHVEQKSRVFKAALYIAYGLHFWCQ